jgi:negative regulator of sigma E activity
MRGNHLEVLSAFFDGEAVAPELLAASLREPGAVDFLVDFARLRTAVHADTSRPTEEFCESMRETLGRGDARRGSHRRLVQMSLAASLALAAALGGFSVRSLLDRGQPRAVDQVMQVRQAPSGASGPMSETIVTPASKVPGRTELPKSSKQEVPSPNLRMRFAEWHDTVL